MSQEFNPARVAIVFTFVDMDEKAFAPFAAVASRLKGHSSGVFLATDYADMNFIEVHAVDDGASALLNRFWNEDAVDDAAWPAVHTARQAVLDAAYDRIVASLRGDAKAFWAAGGRVKAPSGSDWMHAIATNTVLGKGAYLLTTAPVLPVARAAIAA